MAERLDGVAVGAIAVGALFTYSGLTGRSALAAIQALVQGSAPSTAGQANPITSVQPSLADVAASGFAGSGQGSSIAADAQKYVGTGYVFGGAPASDINRKDCSSFVNWVIGHDLGLSIPGYPNGTYDGRSHGPTTAVWLVWTGCETVGHDGNAAAPGDLCVWQTHMGIAIGGGQMVSARSARDNPPTGINTIAGDIPGEVLFVRRLKQLAAPGPVTTRTAS